MSSRNGKLLFLRRSNWGISRTAEVMTLLPSLPVGLCVEKIALGGRLFARNRKSIFDASAILLADRDFLFSFHRYIRGGARI